MAESVLIRDQAYIKYRNIQSVLTLLTEHQPISRTEISRLTEMSPTSITRIINALISLGLVDETATAIGGKRGRKAINLCTRPSGIYTLGVSLEPHRIRLGLLDFGNRLLFAEEIALNQAQTHTAHTMANMAHKLLGNIPKEKFPASVQLRGIGISVSGTVDWEHGIVTKSDQLHWSREAVGDAFAAAFGLPAYVENDVKACLMGERVRRGIPEREVAAYLMIGTGVGVAVTINGKLLRGKSNEAGEIDNVPSGGALLQDHLVETSLVRRAQHAEPSVRTIDDILAAYRLQVSWARLLISDFLSNLNTAIHMVAGFFDPHTIILGGSIVPRITGLLSEEALDPRVRIGENYGDACITGAAIVAQRQAVEHLLTRELDE